MTLKVALQMDPIQTIQIEGDSSFVLALEAQSRGYEVYHYLPTALTLKDGRVIATGNALTVRYKEGDHYTLGEPQTLDLSEMDVILLRQDPPFDMSYITTTHLLEALHSDPSIKTLVVNDPRQVRNAPEKIFMLRYPELLPPTMISRDRAQIKAFRDEHKDIIVKPLYGNGGAGVFHIKPGDENLNSLLEMFEGQSREPVMAQKYLADVRKGDKRIILIDGEPVGAINRVPAAGEARSNMHVGGVAERIGLTKRELEICATIGPDLKALGQIFVGIDVIGDYLTEINVTSPTGLQEINRFDGVCLEARMWDAIESRLKEKA